MTSSLISPWGRSLFSPGFCLSTCLFWELTTEAQRGYLGSFLTTDPKRQCSDLWTFLLSLFPRDMDLRRAVKHNVHHKIVSGLLEEDVLYHSVCLWQSSWAELWQTRVTWIRTNCISRCPIQSERFSLTPYFLSLMFFLDKLYFFASRLWARNPYHIVRESVSLLSLEKHFITLSTEKKNLSAS